MRLPIQFIYTENGIKKDSIAENERMNYVDKLNRDLLKNNLKTKKCQFQGILTIRLFCNIINITKGVDCNGKHRCYNSYGRNNKNRATKSYE